MLFHHNGYVSEDPRVLPDNRQFPEELPDEMDVLIVGSGPAGMIAAASLSMFPNVHTRIIEKRPHRLELGQADGIQSRSVETFQAFGFANEIIDEAYEITEMAFWRSDETGGIVRGERPIDDEHGISEFPHLIVNQARVLDYFARYMLRSPSRMKPDYGWEFVSLEVDREDSHPVHVTVTYGQQERVIKTKYLVGADGAKSKVRKSIGRKLAGQSANHAWGVMDVCVDTDFPDWRTKCAIHSQAGSILHIPREGGFLCRIYVDLGEVPEGSDIRKTPLEDVIEKANQIYAPYSIDVKEVAWHSIYEVAHRLVDGFDDDPEDPRIFLTGDACHTHSAKAGQGMNVSMQDGFNIAWKLGHVLDGRAPQELLKTYGTERQPAAQNLIDFDKEWSSLMADPNATQEVADYYVEAEAFAAGMMTEYSQNLVVSDTAHQDLATGFPVGRRFKSAIATRRCDARKLHLGHEHQADGRWRIYAFADTDKTKLNEWAKSFNLPVDFADIKVIYQQPCHDIEVLDAPELFRPKVGTLNIPMWENVWTGEDIFAERGISRDGAVVVVRPDQYVAGVFPLDESVEKFFKRLRDPQTVE